MNSKPTSAATIAFTLPVSCQICLGKVKQPVVCPNQHVFCGPCMELWLQRNQQCPACRVFITEENPCRKVLGGLNPETATADNFCQKELRRARMELIYKDYENEIDRLEAELEATKQDNRELRNYIHSNKKLKAPTSPVSTGTGEQDRTTVSLLNSKLKDAMLLYEKVQTDLEKYKKENIIFKGKNTDLERENQKLRLELTNRSPRRFGRLTVATLESKLESSEKQILRLQKALERSDDYIKDLEKQLQGIKPGSKGDKVNGHMVMDCNLDFSKTDSNLNDSELPSHISNISEPISEVVSDIRFDDSDMSLKANAARVGHGQSSFDLDIPSPMSKSSRQFTDTDVTEDSRGLGTDDTFVLPRPSSTSKMSGATLDGCKKKLRFTFGDDQGYRVGETTDAGNAVRGKVRFSMDADNSLPNTSDLNISMTPDLEDCFRIMDEAKRKLEGRQQPISLATNGVTSAYTSLTSDLMSAPLHSQQQGLLYPRSMPQSTAGVVLTQSTAGVGSTVPSSGTLCSSVAQHLTANRLQMPGKPFPISLSSVHDTAQKLTARSDVFASNSQSQNGLFSMLGLSQSGTTSQTLGSQVSLSAGGLQMRSANALQSDGTGGFSAGGSVLTNRAPPGTLAMSQLPAHSLGSMLSQPTQSAHNSTNVVNSGAYLSSRSAVPGFTNFTISQ